MEEPARKEPFPLQISNSHRGDHKKSLYIPRLTGENPGAEAVWRATQWVINRYPRLLSPCRQKGV